MYLNFFGLNKDPFKITPDPEFFFSGGNRGAVLEALCYAVAKGEGIVKVVGEVGSGKTMLCRMLERELPPNCEIIYLANPRLNADEILFAIAHELQLSLPVGVSKLEALGVLQKFLLEKHASDRRVVMFIEEAQGMQIDTLEEIRMLSNLETTQEKLLQIVLFGQPELDEKLAAHEIRQLKERITYSFDLAPLNPEEIRDYLYTRLRASNYRGNELFTKRAIKPLAKHSKGLLRRINVLADKALLAAFSLGAHKVERKHVLMAIRDSNFAASETTIRKFRPVLISAAAVICLGALALVLIWQSSLSTSLSNQSLPDEQTSDMLAHSIAQAEKIVVDVPAIETEKAGDDSQLLLNSQKIAEPGKTNSSPEISQYAAAGIQMFEVLDFEADLVSPDIAAR